MISAGFLFALGVFLFCILFIVIIEIIGSLSNIKLSDNFIIFIIILGVFIMCAGVIVSSGVQPGSLVYWAIQ